MSAKNCYIQCLPKFIKEINLKGCIHNLHWQDLDDFLSPLRWEVYLSLCRIVDIWITPFFLTCQRILWTAPDLKLKQRTQLNYPLKPTKFFYFMARFLLKKKKSRKNCKFMWTQDSFFLVSTTTSVDFLAVTFNEV